MTVLIRRLFLYIIVNFFFRISSVLLTLHFDFVSSLVQTRRLTTSEDLLQAISRVWLTFELTNVTSRGKGPSAGLETYFFSHSQTFASGFNLNSQIAVSNSQLVFPTFEQFLTLRCGMATVSWGWNLVHRSPSIGRGLAGARILLSFVLRNTLFFPPLPSHGKTASLCYEALRLFNCFYCRLAETSLRPRSGFGIRWNIELATFFEWQYFQLAKLNFNSHFASLQAWISSPAVLSKIKYFWVLSDRIQNTEALFLVDYM